MLNNDYTPEDFRIYISKQADELQRELERMKLLADHVRESSDEASVKRAVGCMFGGAANIKRAVAKIHRDRFYDAEREKFPKRHAQLALMVSRLRRRLERDAKRRWQG